MVISDYIGISKYWLIYANIFFFHVLYNFIIYWISKFESLIESPIRSAWFYPSSDYGIFISIYPFDCVLWTKWSDTSSIINSNRTNVQNKYSMYTFIIMINIIWSIAVSFTFIHFTWYIMHESKINESETKTWYRSKQVYLEVFLDWILFSF